MNPGLRIEKLRRDHAVDDFDCGVAPLNRFLIRHALQSQLAEAAQTYLAVDGLRVVGFYSLAVGEVPYDGAPERLVKGLARHAVPVMLLARLAVDIGHRGRGLGAGLLRDAMLRTLQVAEIAGIRGLATHAKDEEARAFYGRYDFAPSPTDPLHMIMLLKDVRAGLRA